MKLSQKQIAALWIQEGGNPAKADEASAVAMAESSGDTTIHTPGSCCYGLYQFHKDYFPVACAKKPRCATRMAIKLSNNGTSWEGGKWEAHEDGSYLQFIGKSGFTADTQAAKAKAEEIAKGIIDDSTGVLGTPFGIHLGNPLSGIDQLAAAVEAIARLIENMFTAHFWVRFGKGLLGALLLIYALQGFLKATMGVEIPLGAFNSKTKALAAGLAGK